jgi:methionine-gamma-lyase
VSRFIEENRKLPNPGVHENDRLMSCSGSTTSSEMTEKDKDAAGISPGLVRMSVGITGTIKQRWQQLENALSQCEGRRF